MDARAHEVSLRAGAIEVVRALRARGFSALWAGGCVRDMVLGRVPKDYDVATDATPDEVIACFERCVPVGAAFGVVRVIIPVPVPATDASPAGAEVHHEYEVATFRADLHYEDGRRPTGVRWAGAREDALRRDFTINGMFHDPLAPGGGETVDYVGGREDLERRVVRAIGDPVQRFSEDYLRLLRGVRFAARFGFAIDPATWDAGLALAPRVSQVSAERVKDELDKILGQGHADHGVRLLAASHLLPVVLPEVGLDPALVDRAVQRLARVPAASELGAWGALVYELAPATIEAIALRLKSSRTFQRSLVEATDAARRLAAWPDLGLAAKKRLVRLPTFGVALEVAHAAGTPVAEAHHAQLTWTAAELRPAPLLTGDDLARHGFAPGPGFRTALDAVEEAQLDLRAATVEDALAIVRTALAGAPARRR